MAQFHRTTLHFDRQDLYTDLETRIRYLHSFLDFSSRDIEALTTGAKYIKALIPALVNIVYKKLLQYDITARAFDTRSTSSSPHAATETEEDAQPLSESSPQIMRRKMFLRAYLTRLCSDPSKMDYWTYLSKVGLMHTGRARTSSSSSSPLHIEYMHIGATLSFMQDVLTEALLSHPRLRMERKIALVKAVSKVLWIQNDLFAKWYVRDGEEYARLVPELNGEGGMGVGMGMVGEREGAMGKMGGGVGGVTVTGVEGEIEEADVMRGSCPFRNLMGGGGGGSGKVPRSPLRAQVREEEEEEEEEEDGERAEGKSAGCHVLSPGAEAEAETRTAAATVTVTAAAAAPNIVLSAIPRPAPHVPVAGGA